MSRRPPLETLLAHRLASSGDTAAGLDIRCWRVPIPDMHHCVSQLAVPCGIAYWPVLACCARDRLQNGRCRVGDRLSSGPLTVNGNCVEPLSLDMHAVRGCLRPRPHVWNTTGSGLVRLRMHFDSGRG